MKKLFRKIVLFIVICFAAILINFSALGMTERYERREKKHGLDPDSIEMIDQQVFKYLKNTFFFDLPLQRLIEKPEIFVYDDNIGTGQKHIYRFKTFTTCQLKFELINYVRFYQLRLPERTLIIQYK